MPNELLQGLEVGGGLAERASRIELSRQNFLLNRAATLQQLGQEQQMFPLKMKQLTMNNTLSQYTLDMAHQQMDDKAYDAGLMANATKELGGDLMKRLDAPMPAFKTTEAMKAWALQRKADGETLAGMSAIMKKTDEIKQTSPLYQTQLATQQARLEAEKARQLYYQTRPQPGDKDYGEIQIEDIVPGYKAVYRKGSPGLHLIKTDGTSVTVKDRINLASKISTIRKQMADLDPNSKEYKDLDAIVQAAQAEMTGATPLPSVAAPAKGTANDPLGLFTK